MTDDVDIYVTMLELPTQFEWDVACQCVLACRAAGTPYDEDDIRAQTKELACNYMLDTLNDFIYDMDDEAWNRASQDERKEMARPDCELLYDEYKNKVSKETWKYFTEVFLVRENWHTFATVLDEII